MYKNIIAAFDGSEAGRAALIQSSNWVKRHGGRIILVHAVYFDEEEFTLAPEQRERRFKLGKEVCYQTKDMVLSEFGVQVESLVCEGEPPDVIVDIAREKKADLIAMGTHGRRGIKILYVLPRYEEMIEFFKTESIKQSLAQEADRIINEAKKIASKHGITASATIQEGHVGEKIIETANMLKNDLIVMGAHGWKGVSKAIMGSTTERVIMNASC